MNRSIVMEVSLDHLPWQVRALVPNWKGKRKAKGSDLDYPVLKTNWMVNGKSKVARAVTVEFMLPHAVVRPSFILRTDIWAAGQVGLEIVRGELENAGIVQPLLNSIGVQHVWLKRISITYMQPCCDEVVAARLRREIHQHGLLLGLDISSRSADNRTEYRLSAEQNQSADPAEVYSTLKGVTVSVDRRRLLNFVYIDVVLEEGYLNLQGWNCLESWRSRQLQRDQEIFNVAIRGMFRLDVKRRKHPEPDANVFAKLDLRYQFLLRGYLAGNDPKRFKGFVAKLPDLETSKIRGWYAARKIVLSQTGIDIHKPWEDFQWYRPKYLKKNLIYTSQYELILRRLERRLSLIEKRYVELFLRDLASKR